MDTLYKASQLIILFAFLTCTILVASANEEQTDTDKTISKLLSDSKNETSRVESNLDVVKKRLIEVNHRLLEIPKEIASKRERVGQRLFEVASKMGKNSDEYENFSKSVGRQLDFEINALNEEKSILNNEKAILETRIQALEKKHAVISVKEEMQSTTTNNQDSDWSRVAEETLDHYRKSKAIEFLEFIPARKPIIGWIETITPENPSFMQKLNMGYWNKSD